MLFYGFRGDTLIEMEKDIRPIWDIHVDDKVLTHTGRYMPVIAIQQGRYTGMGIEIKIDGDNTPKIVRGTQKFLSIKTQFCPFKFYRTCIPKCTNLRNCPSKRFKRYTRTWNLIENLHSNDEVAKRSFPEIKCADWLAYPKDGCKVFKTIASKDKYYVYKRILTKKEVEYDDILYNLVVKDDMSYVLNCGLTTHS